MRHSLICLGVKGTESNQEVVYQLLAELTQDFESLIPQELI